MAARLAGMCARIEADFQRHLVPDGVVAGLARFGPDGIEYFLHPRDRTSGVAYRLLPMTRGMLSGLFSVDQVRDHVALIERHLLFPDGVRLMNRPMDYTGGTSRLFKPAEWAANFGREVGIPYVHAHIRYIEAMAGIGRPDEAFRGLMMRVPRSVSSPDVANALCRVQANAYFGGFPIPAFLDRYQASRDCDSTGPERIGVKGGWRVYSSGPGIFLEPVDLQRPRRADLLRRRRPRPGPSARRRWAGIRLPVRGPPVRYRYHVSGQGFSASRSGSTTDRWPPTGSRQIRTRFGGFVISRRAFGDALDREENLVDIFV